MKSPIKISAFFHVGILLFIIVWPSIFPKEYKHLSTVHTVNLVRTKDTIIETKPTPPKAEKKKIEEKKPEKKKIIKKKPKKKKEIKHKKKKVIKPSKKRISLEDKLSKKLDDFSEPEEFTKSTSTVKKQTTAPQMKATISNIPDFPFSWYLSIIQSKISSCWKEPKMALSNNYSSMVSFTIYNDGTVNNIMTKRSSGISSFDESTLQAVKIAQPLPKLPPGYSGSQLVVNIEFNLE